jgi:hypothetical protein
MTRSLLLPALLTLAAAAPRVAEGGAIGLADTPQGAGVGLILGEPTGLALAWRPKTGNIMFDAAVAWSVPDDRIHFHADWLLTLATYRDPATPTFGIPFYTGIGPRVRVGWDSEHQADAALLGIRIPFGLMILPDAVPVDGFVELVPVLTLYPETSLDLDAALGVRVFFGRTAASTAPPTPAVAP